MKIIYPLLDCQIMKINYYREWIDEDYLGWIFIYGFVLSDKIKLNDLLIKYEFTDFYIKDFNEGRIININNGNDSFNIEKFSTRLAIDINKLSASNYIRTDKNMLKNKLCNFQSYEEWGEDLRFYIRGSKIVMDHINQIEDIDEIYYGNMVEAKFVSCKSSDSEFYSYYINIIVISRNYSKVTIIDFGGD